MIGYEVVKLGHLTLSEMDYTWSNDTILMVIQLYLFLDAKSLPIHPKKLLGHKSVL